VMGPKLKPNDDNQKGILSSRLCHILIIIMSLSVIV
jgi:hypothetical protein